LEKLVSNSSVNDTHQLRGESGLWFSPQPFHPALKDQRHLESTLFDVRQIDVARRLARVEKPEPKQVQAGSGLIDIPMLVGATKDPGRAVCAVKVPPPRGLVVPLEPASIPAADDHITRRVLTTICLVLFVATAMLAIEALR
jgi:hypothetical protein